MSSFIFLYEYLLLYFLFRSEYKQMLKQRKVGTFDEQFSPDGSHYLSKYVKFE